MRSFLDKPCTRFKLVLTFSWNLCFSLRCPFLWRDRRRLWEFIWMLWCEIIVKENWDSIFLKEWVDSISRRFNDKWVSIITIMCCCFSILRSTHWILKDGILICKWRNMSISTLGLLNWLFLRVSRIWSKSFRRICSIIFHCSTVDDIMCYFFFLNLGFWLKPHIYHWTSGWDWLPLKSNFSIIRISIDWKNWDWVSIIG